MKKLLHIALIATALFAGAVRVSAAPSPIMDMPLKEWDLGNEPGVKGGAKSVEQVAIYNGKPSPSKYIFTLNDKGEYTKSELVTEGHDKTYVSDFKRNADGSLDEIVQTIRTVGQPDMVNKREKATYTNGKLTLITMEQCLSKKELQPAGTTTIETAADGSRTIDIKDPEGKSQMKITMAYGKDGRMAKSTMSRGSMNFSATVARNAAGLVESAANEGMGGGTTTVKYEMDDKGNWTKVTVTNSMKTPDGKERSFSQEITRKITY
jgi:hypothetical protein